MTIYAHTAKLAHILALKDAMSTVAFARDMVVDGGETEMAWRLLDGRRQWLMGTLSPEEDCQLEECRAEHLLKAAKKKERGIAIWQDPFGVN